MTAAVVVELQRIRDAKKGGVYVCSLRAHTIMQLYSTSVQFSPTLKVAFFSIRKQQYSNNRFILLQNQEFISRIWQLDDGVLS